MKKLFFLMLLTMLSMSTFAQAPVQGHASKKVHEPGFARKGDVELKAMGGIQIYAGESDWKAKFGDRIVPSFTVAGEKWISDYVAFGLAFNESQFKGLYNPQYGGKTHFPAEKLYGKWTHHIKDQSQFDNLYVQKGHFFNLDFTVRWDMLSSFCGLKDRRFTVMPIFGLGWIHAFGKDVEKYNMPTFNADIEARWRLNENLSLLLTLHNALTPDHFDGEHNDSDFDFDGISNLQLGLSYVFKHKK